MLRLSPAVYVYPMWTAQCFLGVALGVVGLILDLSPFPLSQHLCLSKLLFSGYFML